MEEQRITAKEVTGPVNMGNLNEFTIHELAETVPRMIGDTSRLAMKPLLQDDRSKVRRISCQDDTGMGSRCAAIRWIGKNNRDLSWNH